MFIYFVSTVPFQITCSFFEGGWVPLREHLLREIKVRNLLSIILGGEPFFGGGGQNRPPRNPAYNYNKNLSHYISKKFQNEHYSVNIFKLGE